MLELVLSKEVIYQFYTQQNIITRVKKADEEVIELYFLAMKISQTFFNLDINYNIYNNMYIFFLFRKKFSSFHQIPIKKRYKFLSFQFLSTVFFFFLTQTFRFEIIEKIDKIKSSFFFFKKENKKKDDKNYETESHIANNDSPYIISHATKETWIFVK